VALGFKSALAKLAGVIPNGLGICFCKDIAAVWTLVCAQSLPALLALQEAASIVC
jgi:hypothetical protein